MQTYELLVRGRAVHPNSEDMTLVRTSVGIDQIHVMFDSGEWLGFPLTVTFGNGDALVTQSLTVSEIPDSDEWVSEATCTIPHEVIAFTGAIRVTFQGTDAEGNHIITAAGSPLSVEEAGDVVEGDAPAGAPTVDQWSQAYANAAEAANRAASAAEQALAAAQAASTATVPIATVDSVGTVKPDGETVTIDEDGTIHGAAGGSGAGLATADEAGIVVPDGDTVQVDEEGVLSLAASLQSLAVNLQRLAETAFDAEFGADGTLSAATVKPSALPAATDGELGGVMVDNWTIFSERGLISARQATAQVTGVSKPDGYTIGIDSAGTLRGLHACYYGTCATTESSTSKSVSCQGFTYGAGSFLAVAFSNAETRATSITLAVGGSSSRNVYKGSALVSSSNPLNWKAGEVLVFVADGSYWRYVCRANGLDPASVKLPLSVDGAGRLGVKVDGTSIVVGEDGALQAFYGSEGVNLPAATAERLGGVKVGENLTVAEDGTLSAEAVPYELPAATEHSLGGVKADGTTVTVDADGTVHSTASAYELPAATAAALGGVKVGENLSISEDGTLSASPAYELPAATASSLGGVKVGGNLSVSADGTLSAGRAAWHATCSTAATNASKSAECDGRPALAAGELAVVTFSAANVVEGRLTLNVGGSGGRPVNVRNAATSADNALLWDAGETLVFEYTGSAWQLAARDGAGAGDGGRGCAYGTCSAGASSSSKAATCSAFDLAAGALVAVTFQYENTAAQPLLNVNGTGWKNVVYRGAMAAPGNELRWQAGETVTFMYDGSRYRVVARENDGAEPYELPVATASALGGVKVGSTLYMSENGVLNARSYTLPAATEDVLGGVRVGAGLAMGDRHHLGANVDGTSIAVNDDGQLYATGSVSASQLPVATEGTLGVVMPDGETVVVDGDGVLGVGTDALDSRYVALSSLWDGPLYVDDSGTVRVRASDLTMDYGGAITTNGDGRLVVDVNALADELCTSEGCIASSNGALSLRLGQRLMVDGGYLDVNVQNLVDSGGALTVEDGVLRVDLGNLADTGGCLSASSGRLSVDRGFLASALAGDGLAYWNDALAVQAGSNVEVGPDGLSVPIASGGGIENNGSGLEVNVNALYAPGGYLVNNGNGLEVDLQALASALGVTLPE